MLTCPNISKLMWWCHDKKNWDGFVYHVVHSKAWAHIDSK
jgi:hypothetical protein